jgi:6,7-dimethyl-8-ribityllumazine synthase
MKNANKGALEVFDAAKYRVAIVVAEFNAHITAELLQSAFLEAKKYNIAPENVAVYHVSGSVEIPVILRALAETKKFDALVALGAIIRGETDHYEYVASIVSEGVLAAMMQYGVPVGFGVLTCNNEAQAKARVDSGGGAVAAALQNAKIIRDMRS